MKAFDTRKKLALSMAVAMMATSAPVMAFAEVAPADMTAEQIIDAVTAAINDPFLQAGSDRIATAEAAIVYLPEGALKAALTTTLGTAKKMNQALTQVNQIWVALGNPGWQTQFGVEKAKLQAIINDLKGIYPLGAEFLTNFETAVTETTVTYNAFTAMDVAAVNPTPANIAAAEAAVAMIMNPVAKANATARIENEIKNQALMVSSVVAVNPTTIKVTFNQDPTTDDLKVSNFGLSKGTIEAVTATGKVATISVAGLTYGDKPTVTVIKPAFSQMVTIPQVNELYVLDITTDALNDTIKSDGAAKTQITVLLRDKLTGQVVDKDGIIQFQATRGGLGQTTSALQDGKATVQLTSIASATSLTSTITAVVADVPEDSNFEGLSAQKTVTFSPDATDEGQITFVSPVTAESTQGDRLFVTFSDKITAADYKAAIKKARGTNPVRSIDYGIAIDGQTVAVSDVVQSTPKTLAFILDTDISGNASPTSHERIEQTVSWTGAGSGDKNYLRDNVTHKVTFPTKIGSLVLEDTVGISFILTDTSRPAVLGVTAKDQLEFSVRFTESMDERTIEFLDGTNKNPNFLIDGSEVLVIANPTPLQINAAKANNQVILTSLQLGKYNIDLLGKVTDTRNVTTFKMHKDFALAGGAHQIQIANVGDWAQDVDPTQNLLVTDTFDFNVSVDSSIPAATVEIQSPEQWLVTFNKPVSTATSKTAKDVFAIVSDDTNDSFVYGVDYIVSTVDEDGETGSVLAANSSISAEQYFMIEFTQDWTVKYNTASNPSDTYFASTKNPYVITLDALESTIGNKIPMSTLSVNLAYDGQSPKIASAAQIKTLAGVFTSAVRVMMTEPVKNVMANNEGLTPSQQQTSGDGVPQPTYEFVKGNKVVVATASDFTYDDKGFTLSPVAGSSLESGEWTLYIRSISDDIGNTSATESTKVTIVIAAAEETGTKIAWAAFDDAAGAGKLLNDPAMTNDVIYVKFTKEMNPSGAAGVSRTQNYVFAGAPLPTGSQVIKGITGVTNDWDGVTILMPQGTWNGTGTANNDFTNTLNIASNFTSANGEALSGAYEVELSDAATQTTPATLGTGFEALYAQFENQAAFDGEAAAIGAEAFDIDANGKIDEIELTLDPENTGIASGTEILVNGKKFGYISTSSDVATFRALANNEIDSTEAKTLKVTGINSAIIINTGVVIDSAAPVITKAQLNSAKDKIVLTFSEKVTQNNDGTFKKLEAADFALSSGAITAVEHNEASANQVTLTITGGAALTVLDTVTANNTVYDYATNVSAAVPVEIKGTNATTGATASITSQTNGQPAVAAVQATNTIQGVTYTAAVAGVNGNNINITYVVPAANNSSLAVSVVGSNIIVNLETGPTGLGISTASDVEAAVDGNATAAGLVGTSTVNPTELQLAQATTPLTGGSNVQIANDEAVTLTFTAAQATGVIKVVTTNPATDINVNVTAGMTAAQVAAAYVTAVGAQLNAAYTVVDNGDGTLTLTSTTPGTDVTNMTVTVTQQ